MIFLTLIIATTMLLTANARTVCRKSPMATNGIIRYSVIEVVPDYLDEYLTLAHEVEEISMRTEPGVLAMYPLCRVLKCSARRKSRFKNLQMKSIFNL